MTNQPPPPSAQLRAHLARRAWGFLRCLLAPNRCREVDRLLYQYVEHELDPRTHRRLQRHLANCPHCLDYVETYRRVVALAGEHAAPTTAMPPTLEHKLARFIKDNPQLR